MGMKKTIGAVVAGLVVLGAGHFLIHGVWLKSAYMASPEVWRPQDAMMQRAWMLYLSDFLIALGAVLIYVRGVEAKPWAGQGIRFGVLLAMVTAIPQSLTEYVIYPIHHELALHWIIGEGLLMVLLGLVIAAICQPGKSAAQG